MSISTVFKKGGAKEMFLCRSLDCGEQRIPGLFG